MFSEIVEHVSIRREPDDLGLVDTEHCLLIKNDSEEEQTEGKSTNWFNVLKFDNFPTTFLILSNSSKALLFIPE